MAIAMTTFWRNGYWRHSVLGNEHWVSGHDVDRDSWEAAPSSRNEVLLRQERAQHGASARLVWPNADCPVCGAPVFFYKNAAGSRVYFDELGPPWPKHPCTHHPAPSRETPASPVAVTAENLRTQNAFEFIQIWAGDNADAAFAQRYGTLRWDLAAVAACHAHQDIYVIVLSTPLGLRYYLDHEPALPRPAAGMLVAYFGTWISFVADDLNVVERKLQRLSAQRALHHIVGIESAAGKPDR